MNVIKVLLIGIRVVVLVLFLASMYYESVRIDKNIDMINSHSENLAQGKYPDFIEIFSRQILEDTTHLKGNLFFQLILLFVFLITETMKIFRASKKSGTT
jgi:uncharacterized membrane protein